MAKHSASRVLMIGSLVLKVTKDANDPAGGGVALSASRGGPFVELARTKREARALFAALTALAREELPE